MADPSVERIHCNFCRQETKHEVVAQRTHDGRDGVDTDYEVYWRNTYTMLECLGCEAVCLRHEHWFSEADDSTKPEVTFYPPQVAREYPKWLLELDMGVSSILLEVYAALHADSRALAIMGTRTIIDMVLEQKVGDIGGFEQKLDALVDQGFLSRINRDVLAAALDAGHAALHRGHTPSSDEVNQVMDIVENLLQSDLLTGVAKKLAKVTPPRGKQT